MARVKKGTVEALRDVVIVERTNYVKHGRIEIPDSVKDRARREQATGLVVKVGPGTTDRYGNIVPLPLEEGDIVLFSKNSGIEFDVQGRGYLFLEYRDCYGRIPGAAALVKANHQAARKKR